MNTQRAKGLLDTLATLAMLVASIAVVWTTLSGQGANAGGGPGIEYRRNGGAQNIEKEGLETALLSDRNSVGRSSVAIVEFSDFECPYCAKYAKETLPKIKAQYVESNRVTYSFRHFPTAQIHPRAVAAAAVAVCGEQQGGFWKTHDLLFQSPENLALTTQSVAERLQFDEGLLSDCLSDSKGRIEQDLKEGRRLGVTGTPTFFIGNVMPNGQLKIVNRIVGAVDFEIFRSAFDDLLK